MSFTHRGRSLQKVAVIGSGQIGPDIALYFTKVLSPWDVSVTVVDVAEEALVRGQAKVEKKIAKGVATGAFSPEQQQRMLEQLSFTAKYAEISGADLVIEAATEDRALKGRIFAQVEDLVGTEAILASNSSHLEPEVIFADAQHRQRTAVVHYFFPAERNPIVEIVSGADTDPEITEWLLSFYEAIGKVPIRVSSRYGYAIDPVFEGLFQACALIAESGVASTVQIDSVATQALGMTVGSFTAMNLTGGNPITHVGLDNYHDKIHTWFRTPDSLKEMVKTGGSWEVPRRGEEVEVSPELRLKLTRLLRGAYFGLCGEVLDAGLVSIGDFNMALQLALDMTPAFSLMNDLGTAESLRMVKEYADQNPGFPVPACIENHGGEDRAFDIPVILRRDVEGVAVLTVRRPKVLNALNHEVFDQLQQRFAEASEDPAVKAVVLTGFGKKAFVSGADVNFLANIDSAEEGEATSRRSLAVLNFIEDLDKPTVCALNGLAFGGGNELAMACNMRIAAKGLKVMAGQPEPNLGIIPGAGGTQRLPRLVGLEEANMLLRTGRPVSSARALEIGLISEEVEGDLVARAVELAKAIADGRIERPDILRAPLPDVPDQLPAVDIGHLSRRVDEILCQAILEGARMDLRPGLVLEAKCFGEVCGTRDMRIGVDNFLKNGPRSKAPFVHA